MYEITGALRVIIILVAMAILGFFATFLLILNTCKKEIWEELDERDNKTDDK